MYSLYVGGMKCGRSFNIHTSSFCCKKACCGGKYSATDDFVNSFSIFSGTPRHGFTGHIPILLEKSERRGERREKQVCGFEQMFFSFLPSALVERGRTAED